MGLSKAAELNGQPGPRHALDLATPLGLTTAQKVEIQAVFDGMDREAKRIGAEIVHREQMLDSLFVGGRVHRTEVEQVVAEIAALQGQLRFVHIDAHLQTAQALTPQQVASYDRLRGYARADPDVPGGRHTH